MSRVAHNKKTDAQYRKEVKALRPKQWVAVLEPYIDTGTKILHRCTKGHSIMIRPNHVLRGHGCDECAKSIRGVKRRKTHETYVYQVSKIHLGRITVIGKYGGAFVKIKHKCAQCNFIWEVSPDNVVNTSKTGCPRCVKGVKSSKKATRWLREEARKRGIRIRHADNWG